LQSESAAPARPEETGGGKSIRLRLPRQEDRERLRQLCRDQHMRSAFATILFSDRKFDRAFARILASPRHSLGLVAEGDSQIIGAAWASSGEYFIGEGARLATIHMIAVETQVPPTRRARIFMRLVAGVRLWAQRSAIANVLVHVTTGTDAAAAGRLLRASGGTALGGSFLLHR
jgi:hypothetical protein